MPYALFVPDAPLFAGDLQRPAQTFQGVANQDAVRSVAGDPARSPFRSHLT